MRRRFFCTCEGNAAVADGANRNPLSFQDMILTLHNYWSARGCAILQPYDMRVGAGTFHPATTLRSLGPEPWNVAYVQRSEEHTSELQSLMRISYAVFCLKKKKEKTTQL